MVLSVVNLSCSPPVADLLTDRQKVLLHHPDKQQQATREGEGEGEGDDHFKCIKIGTICLASGYFHSTYFVPQHTTFSLTRKVVKPLTVLIRHLMTQYLLIMPTLGTISLKYLDLHSVKMKGMTHTGHVDIS